MYKISIINSIDGNEFQMLSELIKHFAINVYMVQKYSLQDKSSLEKRNYIDNYSQILNSNEMYNLEMDIKKRIDFAKESISKIEENKVTKYFALYDDNKMIAFQTAQIRKEDQIIEEWRNFAYTEQNYLGLTGDVIDTYGNVSHDFISNSLYENITKWFKENNVQLERTATGKNMKKNIFTYIVLKSFIPKNIDESRIYLVKDYSKKYTKDELMGIYKEWSQIICNEQCVDDYSYNVGVHKTKNQY